MIYSEDRDALIGVMDNLCENISDQNGKTILNFVMQVTILKIGRVPSKTDRIIHNAETKTEGFILIESIFN